MRRAGILAKRYAKALFLVGKDKNALDQLHQEMRLFTTSLQENKEFSYFFESPEISRKEKKEKISEMFGDSIGDIFQSFLHVVLDKGREAIFLEIAEAFGETIDEYRNRIKARVTSSIPLTPQMQRDIQKQLEKQLDKEVILVPEVDESILGGIRIMIEGKVIDGTVKGQLNKMRQYLLEQAAMAVN